MPRYIVQRTFPEGFHIPVDRDGAELCRGVGQVGPDSVHTQDCRPGRWASGTFQP